MILKDDVLIQLERIVNSSQITHSPVLTDFLTFVVNETLAGRGARLKEYTIGIHALKKDKDFNPQVDSSVRIHAGRLRRALKEFYYEAGKDDAIIISIPKGSYNAVFQEKPKKVLTRVSTPEAESELAASEKLTAIRPSLSLSFDVRNKVTLIVVPFKNIGFEKDLSFFAEGITEYVNTELTHFQNITVQDYLENTSPGLPPVKETDSPTFHFYLKGSVQWLKEHIRIWVRLTTAQGEHIWAQTYERHLSVDDYYEFQDHVVRKILAAITGLTGAISRYQAKQVESLAAGIKTTYPIQYWYFKHERDFAAPVSLIAKEFYKEVIRRDPYNALAYAYLSQICSAEMLMHSEGYEKLLEDGLRYARASLKYDNQCQEGYIALATNLLFSNSYEDAARALEFGNAINAKSNDYKASMGALLIYMGHYERGKTVLDSAYSQTTYLAWWQIFAFSYYHFYNNKYGEVIRWSERVETSVEQIPILKAASYAFLAEYKKGFDALKELELDDPLADLLEINQLNKLFIHKPLAEKIQAGLKKLTEIKSSGVFGTSLLLFLVLDLICFKLYQPLSSI